MHLNPDTRPARTTKARLAVAAVAAVAVGATITAPALASSLHRLVGGDAITCAPASWDLGAPTGDTTPAGEATYLVRVRKSPCYTHLTGDIPHDAWVGGVAANISEHTGDWHTVSVAADFSLVTVTSSLSEEQMRDTLLEVTGYHEWGKWERIEFGEPEV